MASIRRVYPPQPSRLAAVSMYIEKFKEEVIIFSLHLTCGFYYAERPPSHLEDIRWAGVLEKQKYSYATESR